jgi:hypothetical protein
MMGVVPAQASVLGYLAIDTSSTIVHTREDAVEARDIGVEQLSDGVSAIVSGIMFNEFTRKAPTRARAP